MLAKAITAIDQLSGGRANMGIGAGWAKVEYDAYGIPFPEPKVRLDQLEEGIQVLRGLLHDDVTTFDGTWFTLREARNEPRPVQRRIPIWIGGGGEKRTLRIAARHADGWNVPFVTPEQFAHKCAVLHQHCADLGRDPSSVTKSVNLGLAYTEESLVQQFGGIADMVRGGVLGGSDQQVLERIDEYVAAGAQQVNIALRAPFDLGSVERLAVALSLA